MSDKITDSINHNKQLKRITSEFINSNMNILKLSTQITHNRNLTCNDFGSSQTYDYTDSINNDSELAIRKILIENTYCLDCHDIIRWSNKNYVLTLMTCLTFIWLNSL